jgi:hypothetical protein
LRICPLILPWEFYESIVETLDILADPEMVAVLRASLDDLKRGRGANHSSASLPDSAVFAPSASGTGSSIASNEERSPS